MKSIDTHTHTLNFMQYYVNTYLTSTRELKVFSNNDIKSCIVHTYGGVRHDRNVVHRTVCECMFVCVCVCANVSAYVQ